MKPHTCALHIAGPLLALGIAMGTAHASTEQERRALQQPAPHTTAPASKAKVIAHYATVSGYLDGIPNNTERLLKFKADADVCVDLYRGYGKPINLPTEWPDFLNGTRTDTYTTERYSIKYKHTWVYGTYAEGCSLAEGYGYNAHLKSTAGRCYIDLIGKTASGQCNLATHRAAKILMPMVPKPGPLQVIAGLRCGIFTLAVTDLCIAVDGRMKPSYPLVLSEWAEHGVHHKATSAALDMEVSESVFTPHLQGGFTVTEKPR